MCSCLHPIGGDNGKVTAAVSAYTGRWLHDNKGNTPLLRSWGPTGPRVPYIDSAQGQGVSRRAISLWQAGRLSEGLGTDTDPECPCSLLIRVIPPGCPTGRLWGIFTGQCSMDLWPVNCAIRCRLWHDDGTMQAPSGARLPSVAPSRCACTMGRGSDPALFPWTGVHSLGSSL